MTIPADLSVADEPAWLLQQGSRVLVLDGYGFDLTYQQQCWQPGQGLVVFDDFARAYTCADVILNAAGSLSTVEYATLSGPGTQLCLGPAFALLRDSFWQAQGQAKRPPNTNRLFLSLGGADPQNHTLPLMQALAALFPTKRLDVLTGAAYQHQPDLTQAAATLPNVRLHHNLSSDKLADLLLRCGVFVCPPSGMAYECAAIGGLLFLVQTADNQQLVYDYLTSENLALPYTALENLSPDEWPDEAATLRQRQRAVFNLNATEHQFRQAFGELLETYDLEVRRAAAHNAVTYFAWANDPTVRATAVQPIAIDWITHAAWFERRLADPDSYLYLFEWAGCLVGQVRIQFTGTVGTISYSLDAAWRGKKLGFKMLRRAMAELRRERQGAWTLAGVIRTDNLASVRIFERLGFRQTNFEIIDGAGFAHFQLEVTAVPTFAG